MWSGHSKYLVDYGLQVLRLLLEVLEDVQEVLIGVLVAVLAALLDHRHKSHCGRVLLSRGNGFEQAAAYVTSWRFSDSSVGGGTGVKGSSGRNCLNLFMRSGYPSKSSSIIWRIFFLLHLVSLEDQQGRERLDKIGHTFHSWSQS